MPMKPASEKKSKRTINKPERGSESSPRREAMKKDLSKTRLGWIANGTENVNKVRIFVLRGGLRMEANPHLKGMKVTRGRTCYSIIKEEFGFRGNKLKVLKQLNEWIEKNINEPFLEPL